MQCKSQIGLINIHLEHLEHDQSIELRWTFGQIDRQVHGQHNAAPAARLVYILSNILENRFRLMRWYYGMNRDLRASTKHTPIHLEQNCQRARDGANGGLCVFLGQTHHSWREAAIVGDTQICCAAISAAQTTRPMRSSRSDRMFLHYAKKAAAFRSSCYVLHCRPTSRSSTWIVHIEILCTRFCVLFLKKMPTLGTCTAWNMANIHEMRSRSRFALRADRDRIHAFGLFKFADRNVKMLGYY